MFGCYVHILRLECRIVVVHVVYNLDYDTTMSSEQNNSYIIWCSYKPYSWILILGKPNSP